ncbi:MAG: type 1 glutamine amidotransferase [Caldiserica bacterium]|jgi:protease I|nr:type 1 glutamine amidotransferase [Caldisericota bacterium]MDH7561848.1 type 1 glutamine amidotransferase domain-containing protein [Caldisericota bacterium]
MSLKGIKVAMLVGPGYEDLEFWVPYMRLIEEEADITIVGIKEGETYTSKSGGLKVIAPVGADSLKPEDFHAVLVPGGWAPDKLRRYPSVLKLVKGVYEKGGIVGSICHAGLVLISAGIVKGRKATGSLGIKDDLLNAGAIWVDEPAFREGNLVWGRVVEDIPFYCRELVKALNSLKERA